MDKENITDIIFALTVALAMIIAAVSIGAWHGTSNRAKLNEHQRSIVTACIENGGNPIMDESQTFEMKECRRG